MYLDELFRFWKNFYVHFLHFYVKNFLADRMFTLKYYDLFIFFV